jgi:glycerophosphoryl diester phosphodiesterase
MQIARLRYPLIIAHRGYSSRYPENTLIAFEEAIQSNVQMIELDVTLTRDRRLVVIHDETLERTTNGRGRVADHTLAELKGLDAGSWFSERFSGETIPTLDEALAMIAGRAAVNIEIKPEAFEAHHPDDAVERQVCRLLQRRRDRGDILVSSFDVRVLAEIARTVSPPALGYLTMGGVEGEIFDACQDIGAFSWNAHYRDLGRPQIEKAHASGLRVFAYTVNSPDGISALIEMGVDGIFTDEPEATDAGVRARRNF